MTLLETSSAGNVNEAPVDSTSSMFNATEIESLCLRMHNNTAFMGVQPFTRLLLYSASECRRNCIDLYPNCVAVMFYYLHERDKDHICYLFNKNSIDQDVALVPEKPTKKLDMIRSLEIVADCHQFDPFPPLFTDFTASTDSVSKKKRDVGYDRPIEATGPWSAWSECSARSSRQVRSQLCEYGRNIQRRRCSSSSTFHHELGYGVKITSYAPSIDISISYPPYPYQHPDVSSEEYKRIMSAHSKQMERSCCYWLNYFRQKSVNMTSDQKIKMQRQLGISDECLVICSTSAKPKLKLSTDGQPPPHVPLDGQRPSYVPVDGQRPPYLLVDGQRPPQTPIDGQLPYQIPVVGKALPISVWSTWSEWSFCSATCGVGVIQRYRICSTEQCKGENVEWRTCHKVVPCVASWAEWSSWSTCSATCGAGERTRSRYCYLGVGYCTGPDYEITLCETIPCPGWGQWESWSPCSVTCGTGAKTRTRICQGDNCIGETHQEVQCYNSECEGWSEWQQWSACSVSCGEGVIIRERVCMGMNCIGESSEQNTCVEHACSAWQEWGDWSVCSAKCDFGISTRKRLCHGIFCPGKRVEVMPCHAGRCMMWSPWQEWSECSVTCGSGRQQRYRTCIGDDCPGNAEDIQQCETSVSCPQWTEWTAWSRCTHDCGIGERVRHRECSSEDGSSESCKGAKSESAVCLERLCCEWTSWTSWTPCSHRCGTGRSSRTKMCLRLGYEQDDSSCTGHCYGDSREDKSCSEHAACATVAYPTICILATVPYYKPGLPGTTVMSSPDGVCPLGYVPASTVPGYTPATGVPVPGHVSTPAAPSYAELPTVPSSDITGSVLPSIAPSYTSRISSSGYVFMPGTSDYAGAPSVPGYFPAPVQTGYGAVPGVSSYAFVPGTSDYTVAPGASGYFAPPSTSAYVPPGASGYFAPPSAPGYVPPSAPGYISIASVPGYVHTSSGYAISPSMFVDIRCHWAEWHQWSACDKTCYHHVRRRSRHCLGEDGCICSGDAQEEMNCLLPAECKN
uniref:Apple domain-containing protein n=1 Tax=Elaeophora elaphi TaxID=1147741 RepID=A0A0R3RYW5_9BILA